MPENPDFEQIAGALLNAINWTAEGPGCFVQNARAIRVVLRQIWNARGAADITAIDAAFDSTRDAEAQRLLIEMAKDWTDPAVVRDAPDRVPVVIEQLIAEISRPRGLTVALSRAIGSLDR